MFRLRIKAALEDNTDVDLDTLLLLVCPTSTHQPINSSTKPDGGRTRSLGVYSRCEGRYGDHGAKSSASKLPGRSIKFAELPRDVAPAPVSGSIVTSGRMAPRMKLARRASRDLSADIQASTGHILLLVNKRIKHG